MWAMRGRRISLQPKLQAGPQKMPAGLWHARHCEALWALQTCSQTCRPCHGSHDITRFELMAEHLGALPV